MGRSIEGPEQPPLPSPKANMGRFHRGGIRRHVHSGKVQSSRRCWSTGVEDSCQGRGEQERRLPRGDAASHRNKLASLYLQCGPKSEVILRLRLCCQSAEEQQRL